MHNKDQARNNREWDAADVRKKFKTLSTKGGKDIQNVFKLSTNKQKSRKCFHKNSSIKMWCTIWQNDGYKMLKCALKTIEDDVIVTNAKSAKRHRSKWYSKLPNLDVNSSYPRKWCPLGGSTSRNRSITVHLGASGRHKNFGFWMKHFKTPADAEGILAQRYRQNRKEWRHKHQNLKNENIKI